MIVKLLTQHHLEFLSFKGGSTGSSESTLFKNTTLLEITCRCSYVYYFFAGMVLLIAVILFGIQDQSIHASEPDVMEFKGAYFHFSFWGVAASCAFSFIVTVLHCVAIFKYTHADIRFRRIQRQANIPVQPMSLMPDNGQHPYKTGKTQGLKDIPVFVMNELRLVDSVRFRGPIYENQDENYSNLKDLGCKIFSSCDLLPNTRLEKARPSHEDFQNSNEHAQLTKSTMAFVPSEKYIEPFDTIRSKGTTFKSAYEVSTTLDKNSKGASILESFGEQCMSLDMSTTDLEVNDTANSTSIQPWATFGSPAKRHLNGVSLEDRQRPQADCLLGDKCIATTFGNESACLESSRKRGASSRKGEASPRKGDGSSRKVDVSSSKREASSRKGDGSFRKGDASFREGESKPDFTNNEIIGSNIKTVVNPIDCMPLKTGYNADNSPSTGEDNGSVKKQASSQAKGTNSTSLLRNEVELVPLACEGEKQDEVLYLSTTATIGHKQNVDGQTKSEVADCSISIYSTRHIRRGSDQHTRKIVPKENPKHLWRRAWTSFADKEQETEPSEL